FGRQSMTQTIGVRADQRMGALQPVEPPRLAAAGEPVALGCRDHFTPQVFAPAQIAEPDAAPVAERSEPAARRVAEPERRLVYGGGDGTPPVVQGDECSEEGNTVGEAQRAVDRIQYPLERRVEPKRREFLPHDPVVRE